MTRKRRYVPVCCPLCGKTSEYSPGPGERIDDPLPLRMWCAECLAKDPECQAAANAAHDAAQAAREV